MLGKGSRIDEIEVLRFCDIVVSASMTGRRRVTFCLLLRGQGRVAGQAGFDIKSRRGVGLHPHHMLPTLMTSDSKDICLGGQVQPIFCCSLPFLHDKCDSSGSDLANEREQQPQRVLHSHNPSPPSPPSVPSPPTRLC
jgi:hypothetical protein